MQAEPLRRLLQQYRSAAAEAVTRGDLVAQAHLLPLLRDLETAIKEAADQPEWGTPKQYATRWQVSYESARRWATNGKVPSKEVGAGWRVDLRATPPGRGRRRDAGRAEVTHA